MVDYKTYIMCLKHMDIYFTRLLLDIDPKKKSNRIGYLVRECDLEIHNDKCDTVFLIKI